MKAIKRPESLLRWLTSRQMSVEGGFSGKFGQINLYLRFDSGRANKLVDSCYNYWQGASFPIVQNILDERYVDSTHWLCDEKSLQGRSFFPSRLC